MDKNTNQSQFILRRGIVLGALGSLLSPRSLFSAAVINPVSKASSVSALTSVFAAQISPHVAGLVQSATGVVLRQKSLFKWDPLTAQCLSMTKLKSHRDYENLFDKALKDFEAGKNLKEARSVSGYGSDLGAYFSERLIALTHLYFYDKKTLADLQVQPEWHEHLAPKRSPHDSPRIQWEFDYQDQQRLGTLTHAKIAQEIATLMTQLTDLTVKLDRIRNLASPLPGDELMDPYSSLDLIIQQRVFDSWHFRPILDEYREAFARLNLTDKEKIMLLIEVIDHHEGLPNGKTVFYHERPGLTEIPPVIEQHMSDYLRERRFIAETMTEKDPNFSGESFARHKVELLQTIDRVFAERKVPGKTNMRPAGDQSLPSKETPVYDPTGSSSVPFPLARSVVALKGIWQRFSSLLVNDVSGGDSVATRTVPSNVLVLEHNPIRPLMDGLDIIGKDNAPEAVKQPLRPDRDGFPGAVP